MVGNPYLEITSGLPVRTKPLGRWVDGWMQGALESGNRVAREVNAAV